MSSLLISAIFSVCMTESKLCKENYLPLRKTPTM